MRLYIDYKNHWHLKDNDYVDIKVAKNDSEKVALVGEILQAHEEEMQELKIKLQVGSPY